MQSFTLKHSLPLPFISRLANVCKTGLENNYLSISNRFIRGHFMALSFKNGIQCLISQYRLKGDFHLHRIPVNNKYYILRIYEIQDSVNSFVQLDGKYISLQNKNYTSTLLISSQASAFICANNGLIKTLEIYIPIKWLENKIVAKDGDDVLFTWLNSGGTNFQFGNDGNVKFHFKQIISNAGKAMQDRELIEKSITLLLEKYIIDLNEKFSQKAKEHKTRIVKDEVARLIAVKDFLIKDLGTVPPSFSTLTLVAAMSSTSLKTKFKKMYGDTVFEFYQRNRMQKARVLLLSHRYSIKEIGTQLGYLNLSNFSIAFKKEFGELPSELSKKLTR